MSFVTLSFDNHAREEWCDLEFEAAAAFAPRETSLLASYPRGW